ncbi:hypothetical protein CgunFtcFv8_019564 [Champsocephalus gunnari]|uniref:Uncharacterized protein n=1 Tax=Champsocephalus gunnari TaxID=52237 RepID=A0AAN8DFP6_CHAGU|nr:hypothetical protein CgunFtcFv8_019564 [Champsocephalus gunnari]
MTKGDRYGRAGLTSEQTFPRPLLPSAADDLQTNNNTGGKKLRCSSTLQHADHSFLSFNGRQLQVHAKKNQYNKSVYTTNITAMGAVL